MERFPLDVFEMEIRRDNVLVKVERRGDFPETLGCIRKLKGYPKDNSKDPSHTGDGNKKGHL